MARDSSGTVVLGNTIQNNGQYGIQASSQPGDVIPVRGAGRNVVSGSPSNVLLIGSGGPGVQGLNTVDDGVNISAVTLSFTAALNRASASSKKNYAVEVLNAKGKKIRTVPIASVSYDASTLQVTVTFQNAQPIGGIYQIVVYGQVGHGVQSTRHRLIDGNNDGRPGGNFVARFGNGSVQTKRSVHAKAVKHAMNRPLSHWHRKK